MDFKSFKTNEVSGSFKSSPNQNYLSLLEELNQAKNIIKQLKDDKKKLQDALRNVISERNKKSDKIKEIREKYNKIKIHMKNELDFVMNVKKEYQEFGRIREKNQQKSQNLEEIRRVFDMIKSYTKSQKISLKFDEKLVECLKDSVKNEKWDEFVVHVLRFSIKSAKKQQDFSEEDTPQFHKQTSDSKIDQFLESSKSLLDSLSVQQERLQKLSDDYHVKSVTGHKHTKTMSMIPSTFTVLTPSSSARNIKSSLGESSGKHQVLTTKASKNEFFEGAKPKRLIKYSG